MKKGKGKGERVWNASCVYSGGFYVGVFINKMGDENFTEMKEVRFYNILGF